ACPRVRARLATRPSRSIRTSLNRCQTSGLAAATLLEMDSRCLHSSMTMVHRTCGGSISGGRQITNPATPPKEPTEVRRYGSRFAMGCTEFLRNDWHGPGVGELGLRKNARSRTGAHFCSRLIL